VRCSVWTAGFALLHVGKHYILEFQHYFPPLTSFQEFVHLLTLFPLLHLSGPTRPFVVASVATGV
jgi:hypothetical protein